MTSEVDAAACAPSPAADHPADCVADAPRPIVLDWEHAKVGDRLAGFSVFLPARPPGPVLLAVSAMVGNGLAWRFPTAVRLSRPGEATDIAGPIDSVAIRSLAWDGAHLPVRPRSAGLIIVDVRHADPEILRAASAAS